MSNRGFKAWRDYIPPDESLIPNGKSLIPEGARVPGWRKYRNVPTYVDGIRFASKREAGVYQDLKLQQAAGLVRWFILQTPFRLPGNVVYRADFLVLMASGAVRVIDAKGIDTPASRIKRRITEATYPGVTIELL